MFKLHLKLLLGPQPSLLNSHEASTYCSEDCLVNLDLLHQQVMILADYTSNEIQIESDLLPSPTDEAHMAELANLVKLLSGENSGLEILMDWR
jgi:hypothetical protein